MKRLFLISTAILVLLLSACSNAGTSAPENKVEPPDNPVVNGEVSTAPSVPPETSGETAQIPDVTTPESEVSPAPSPELREMSVSSSGIVDGMISDEYGMRGKQQKNGTPTLSLPLTITDAPDGVVCYAIMMLDPDSVPLCGYEWVHWLAVFTEPELAENASIDDAANMVQGKNDFGATGYGGPTPPDKPHTYVITVYALNAKPELGSGFSKDQFLLAIEGCVLAEVIVEGKYSN